MRTSLVVLGLSGCLLGASAFSPNLSCLKAGLSTTARAVGAVRTGACATRMETARRLDPMQLVQDKAMQTCALRPHRSKKENRGRAIATFALG